MAKRRSRRFTRGKREYVWTAVLIDEVVSTGVGGGGVIVASTDWFGTPAVARREATLLRIRGWLTTQMVTAGAFTISDHWVGYIAKFTSDETAVNPALAAAYTDENILWTGGGGLKLVNDTANGIGYTTKVDMNVDVKAKRRISTDDNISLVYTLESSAGSRDMHTFGVLRGLIALS